MKSNIIRCDYYGKLNSHGEWWKWNETCDKCGAIIRDFQTMDSKEPDTSEADFCFQCLQYLIKKNIRYEDAKAKYKVIHRKRKKIQN